MLDFGLLLGVQAEAILEKLPEALAVVDKGLQGLDGVDPQFAQPGHRVFVAAEGLQHGVEPRVQIRNVLGAGTDLRAHANHDEQVDKETLVDVEVECRGGSAEP